MNKILNWIANTKLGHFVWQMVFSILGLCIIYLISPKLNSINNTLFFIIGTTIISIVFCIGDDNDKWI